MTTQHLFIFSEKEIKEYSEQSIIDNANETDFYINNELSNNFIYKYADQLNWYYLVKYQKLSPSIIEYFFDTFVEEHLVELLIKYQKLGHNTMSSLYGMIKHWELLVKYQKLGNTTITNMIKFKYQNSSQTESIKFNKLIIKYQLTKQQSLTIIV